MELAPAARAMEVKGGEVVVALRVAAGWMDGSTESSGWARKEMGRWVDRGDPEEDAGESGGGG